MNQTAILELAAKWDRLAIPPDAEDGSKEAEVRNAVDRGYRSACSRCADDLRMLVKLLGDPVRMKEPT